jgi:lipoprotein NlpD
MPFRILVTTVLALLLAGCPPPSGVYHTVQEGQNLYRIGRTYGVEEQYLARLNGISDPTRLAVGQKLFIPGAQRVKTISPEPNARIATPPKPPPSKTVSPSAPSPARKSSPVAGSPIRSGTQVSYRGKFGWPLQGKILKKFTAKTGTPTKGIEIAARRGTPVLSAAAGKVIYSGNGISGYGNLIILKHEDSFFTVYGFNDKNLVEAGAFVGKGERIALSGVPPGDSASRLHFEIRNGKEAVDPIFYLP